VTLATSITAVPKSPTSLQLLAPDGVGAVVGVPVADVPAGQVVAPFARAVGADPDTPVSGLSYRLLEARGSSGTLYPDRFSINSTTGEITRIGTVLPAAETEISFRVRVSDGSTTPLERSFRVGVLSDLNRAPLVVAGSAQRSLAAVTEASANPAGASVAALFGPSFDDSRALQQLANDPGTSFAGVAVVQNAATALQGAWQYRLNADSPWQVLPAVAETSPFILTAQSQLRFLPRPGFSGTPGALSARLLDGSRSWTTGSLSSALPTGGAAAASSGLVTLATSITALPKAPDSLALAPGALLRATTAAGSEIARLRATDPDTAISALIYELLPAAASNDNNLVTVDPDGTVRLAASPTDPQLLAAFNAQLLAARNRNQLQIAVQVRDPVGLTRQETLRIAAENDTNRAPVALVQEAAPPSWAPLAGADVLRQRLYLQPIDQGTAAAAISGRRVDDLFAGSAVFSDPAAPGNASSAFAGIAVVANAAAANPLNGRWEYFSAGAWQAFPAVSEARPLMLRADAQLRFVPTSAFSGVPGALTLRLLDDSITVTNGLLPQGTNLTVGGSGAASADTLQLLSYVNPIQRNLAPQSVFFQSERSIANTNGEVAPGTLLGRFTALDPDTPISELAYRLITGSIQPSALADALVVSGNQLRVGNAAVNLANLQNLRFRVAVSDRQDGNQEPEFFDFDSVFGLSSTSFETPAANLVARSEQILVPHTLTAAPSDNNAAIVNNAVVFSAVGAGGALRVLDNETTRPLTEQDLLQVITPESLNLAADQQITNITAYTPSLLDFEFTMDVPGEVVRFEYALESRRVDELRDVRYMKLLVDGSFSVFDYFTDGFGVSTGARLEERREGGDYIPLELSGLTDDVFIPDVYMAVYVLDNGRGDDDPRLGIIRDPGGLFGIRAEALRAREQNFNFDPSNLALRLQDPNNDGFSDIEFVANREALYDNIVNFYRVADAATGEIVIAGVSHFPGDPNYLSLATGATNRLLTTANTEPSLAVANLTEVTRDLRFIAAAGVWMPYVVVTNTGHTYVPYAAANPDGFNHFAHARSGGFDYFFVEDLPGGGDRDYDDIIIRVAAPR